MRPRRVCSPEPPVCPCRRWRPPSAVKLGYVSPQTGPLAAFAEADNFIIDGFAKATKAPASTYKVVVKDSQSNPNRAAEVAKELIVDDKVNLMLVASTPETTNPVATTCEAEDVPCISTVAPWQPWFIGQQGNPARSDLVEAVQLRLSLLLGAGRRHCRLHQHVGPGRDQQEGRRAVPQ